MDKEPKWVKYTLITIALIYLFLVLFLLTFNIFYQAFKDGIVPFLQVIQAPEFLNALWLSILIAIIVVPINTIFGLCAAWAITRQEFPGKTLIISILDVPFSVSPVIAGLMIILLYGQRGWFGGILDIMNIKIVFALPGMVLATAFITLPFVAREVIPVLEEIGTDQEKAAETLGANNWQIFWRVTLPNIRWGLLYGVILTNARAMGEIGAVAVVSGNIISKTQTLPLFVEDAYKQYDSQSAFAAAVLLAGLGIITLILKEVLIKVKS